MLSFAKRGLRGYWHVSRKPQPSNWNGKLTQRDTVNSGASVTIYRSRVPDAIGSILNPSTREIINQTATSPESLMTFGIAEDKTLSAEKKELLVVVKRGHGADISKPIGPPYAPDDMREWAEGMAWPEIRRIGLTCEYEDDEGTETAEVDTSDAYRNVEEYEWRCIY